VIDTLAGTILGAVLAFVGQWLGSRWQARRDREGASVAAAMTARNLLVELKLAFEMRWIHRSPERTNEEEALIRRLIYSITAHEQLIDDVEVRQHIRPLRQMIFLVEEVAAEIGVNVDHLACDAAIEATGCLTRYVQGKPFDPTYRQPHMAEYVDGWRKWVDAQNAPYVSPKPVEAP
jgi:hypothetical protein